MSSLSDKFNTPIPIGYGSSVNIAKTEQNINLFKDMFRELLSHDRAIDNQNTKFNSVMILERLLQTSDQR